ncbi:MAG: Do family serine endopeptidase [Rhodobacteraceae bacterium]|nr:Do family serine endopeptidase [Paracoccaceae bacterium]
MAFIFSQAATSVARGAPDSFADLAEQLSPSVVNITTTTVVAGRNSPSMPQVPEGSPFEDFFRDFFDDGDGNKRQRRASALGSGFIISADGYVVTNNHVIDGADEIIIELYEGGELEAKLVGRDAKTDIALLKVEADEPLPFVSFGDSDISRVGDWVMAIGNPLGQGFSVSAGIISARNRSLRGSYDDFIQTDAAINKGNSGGPLFNMDGNVIGVNTAIISPTGGSIGLGFSMSSNVVSKVVDQLKEFGETRRGWLGVRIQEVDQDLADAIGLEKVAGALISDVPEGPAADAGMLSGDVILNFDGKEVEDSRGLVRAVGDAEVGKTVRVVIFRDGKTQTLKVVLGRREDAERPRIVPTAAKPDVTEQEALGMTLTSLTDEIRQQLSLDGDAGGVAVINVDETSDAFEKGIRPGDLISEVGQKPVSSAKDVAQAFKDAREAGRKSVLLLVRRGGDPRFVALSLGS